MTEGEKEVLLTSEAAHWKNSTEALERTYEG